MKISGRSLALDQRVVTLPRRAGEPIQITVRALPIGCTERLDAELPRAVPPLQGYARDENRQYVRDEEGRLVPAYNFQDPGFLAAVRIRNRRLTVLMIAEGLRDGEVAFDSQISNFKSQAEFADALWAELQTSGLGMGEMTSLLAAIMQLSGVGAREIEAARADFSASPGPAATAGNCPAGEPNSTGAGASGNGSASAPPSS